MKNSHRYPSNRRLGIGTLGLTKPRSVGSEGAVFALGRDLALSRRRLN